MCIHADIPPLLSGREDRLALAEDDASSSTGTQWRVVISIPTPTRSSAISSRVVVKQSRVDSAAKHNGCIEADCVRLSKFV